ncbi:hypothetical protein HNV27_37515, partial [Myxococcus xanthus]|uniref:hypothetical protein n=1 Tax=Myxococcus xanthus TaxID=34 RepID=UPI00148D17B2
MPIYGYVPLSPAFFSRVCRSCKVFQIFEAGAFCFGNGQFSGLELLSFHACSLAAAHAPPRCGSNGDRGKNLNAVDAAASIPAMH